MSQLDKQVIAAFIERLEEAANVSDGLVEALRTALADPESSPNGAALTKIIEDSMGDLIA